MNFDDALSDVNFAEPFKGAQIEDGIGMCDDCPVVAYLDHD
ncbi:hypothetical protein PLANPX_1165 [Lacipirellula parvula]|uniref:Uncharacterized protein n=1 Tax=Lacipirellula parvula TaxID=2650471 RepID=A0A5K7XB64_9BACT|nr:hypothetical protein PLANPX_1165 [Lacipirellula parvula]